jgi:thiamine kinase-like enzyme
MLEDMAPVQSGDMVAGASLEQAELAIREIAGFHATWWENPELEEMTWMPRFGPGQISQLAGMYQLAWDPFCERMGHRLPEQMLEIGDRLGQHFDAVWSYIQGRPWTIVHSDYHVENLFFTPSESGTGLVVADWQLLMFGRGVFDVAYFLGGNLGSKDRAENEMDLLRIYHEILVKNGVKDYTFDQCLHDYRFSMLYGLSRHIIVAGLVLTAEEAERACEFIIPRYIAAVLDLNAGELLPR